MSRIQAALDAYKAGEFIIVTDDESRENEGDLMLLAEKATAEKTAFMVRHTTGILCVAMTKARNKFPIRRASTLRFGAQSAIETGPLAPCLNPCEMPRNRHSTSKAAE